jgi:outer membrane protein OmpA-like peptidoglycan-associated protein
MRKLLIAGLLGLSSLALAQEPMRVVRCDAVAMRSAISNIYVTPENETYVTNEQGVFRVFDLNLAEPLAIPDGQESLLQYPGGNALITWDEGELNRTIGGVLSEGNPVTATFYDADQDELWVGTAASGLFICKTKPRLRLVEQMDTRNSKLRSDYINTIHRDYRGTYWIGTRYGVLKGRDNRWDVIERDFDIESIATDSSKVWFLGNNLVGYVDRRDTWYPIELPNRSTEGRLRKIAFDPTGNLWIASEILTHYNTETQDVTVYGPAAYYTSEFATVLRMNRDSALWVGTEDKGLYLIEKESAMTVSLLVDRELTCAEDDPGGRLEVRITGGSEPYRIDWSQQALTGSSADQLMAGTYTVSVTDASGKSKTATAELEDPNITLDVRMQAPESEPGAQDGRAIVEVSGGSPGYRYAWDTGEKVRVASSLTGGIHRVTVTDTKGCTAVGEVSVEQKAADLIVDITTTSTIPCADASAGALSATVQGGREPYTYAWNNGANTAQVQALTEGAYQLTVTDSEGTTQEAEVLLIAPLPLEVDVQVVSNASTNQSDGTAEVTVTGGTEPYTYRWDSRESEARAVRLNAGTHQVTVTDANGCTAVASVEITEDILPLTTSLEITNPVLCPGNINGALSVQPQGGKPPYAYRWNSPALSGRQVSGLPSGDYAVTVVDAAGQETSAQASLSEPSSIQVQAVPSQPASTGNADGQATVQASGGAAPYTYTWTNGQTTEIATGLAPGDYQVTVTDANGCTATGTVAINENILPLTATVTPTTELTCAGQTNAGARVAVQGGKAPFRYAWSSGSDGSEVSGLAAGNYTVTVTDAEGTTQTASLSITEPEALTTRTRVVEPASTDGSDGQATVEVSGGTAPYSYAWDNGQTNADVDGLTPGVHQVTVTDANGCTTLAEVTIPENILPLAVDLSQTADINCAGDQSAALSVEVAGGKSPFSYTWSSGESGAALFNLPAGAYGVTVTDAEGSEQSARLTITEPKAMVLNAAAVQPATTGNRDGQARVRVTGGSQPYTYSWDSGENEATATRLAPGTHVVTVTDASGCTATADVAITENILPLVVQAEQGAAIDCAGGTAASARALVEGGKGPFTYAWNTGATTEEVTGLSAGTYTVTVTDVEGTAQTARLQIEEPPTLVLDAVALEPASTDGSDGQAQVRVTGGSQPYTYRWDSGETEATATELTPGTHQVTVTDASGCTTTAEVTITENILPLELTLEVYEPISCYGAQDGALSTKVQGGKAPYSYDWGADSFTDGPTGLSPGTYSLTVSDATGQSAASTISLSQPDSLAINLRAITPSTGGAESDGKAEVVIAGGTPDYQIRWSSGEITPQANRLDIGNQGVTVTDANGCEVAENFPVEERMIPGLVADEVETGQTIQMEALRFDADSTNINEGMYPLLEELYQFLNANPNVEVEIGGHTNNIPPDYYCDQLSTARAKSVADYLVRRGVSDAQVSYRGYGKRQPIASNDTPEGRAKNQRVEIKILDAGG